MYPLYPIPPIEAANFTRKKPSKQKRIMIFEHHYPLRPFLHFPGNISTPYSSKLSITPYFYCLCLQSKKIKGICLLIYLLSINVNTYYSLYYVTCNEVVFCNFSKCRHFLSAYVLCISAS